MPRDVFMKQWIKVFTYFPFLHLCAIFSFQLNVIYIEWVDLSDSDTDVHPSFSIHILTAAVLLSHNSCCCDCPAICCASHNHPHCYCWQCVMIILYTVLLFLLLIQDVLMCLRVTVKEDNEIRITETCNPKDAHTNKTKYNQIALLTICK